MSYTRSSATFGHRVRKTAVGSTEHRIRTRTRTRNASDLASDSHAIRSVELSPYDLDLVAVTISVQS